MHTHHTHHPEFDPENARNDVGARGRRPLEGFDPVAMGPGGFGPGMFGPMGPFGPGARGRGFRGGPEGRRGPGRGRRGDVRNAVLALLAEQPLNGYQLIEAIDEKSQGLWRPGAGSVYPALGLLDDEGLIVKTEVDGKALYQLTDAGKAYVESHADDLSAPWEKVAEPHKGFLETGQSLKALAMAVHQVVVAGDQSQVGAATAILDQARKDIYKLLAGE